MYVLFEKKSQGPNSHLAMPIWLQKEIGEQGQKGAMKPRGESKKEGDSHREFQGRRHSGTLACLDILQQLPIGSQQLAVSG